MLRQPALPVADDYRCPDLTERQASVWRAMRYLQSTNGDNAPSRADLGTMLNMTPTGAASHFPALLRKGYLRPVQRFGRAAFYAVVPAGVVPDSLAPVAPECLPLPGGPQPDEGFTARQIQVWRTLLAMQERDGAPPTQEALGRALGMATVQGVRTHFAKLEAAGYVAHRRRLWFAVRKEVPCESLPSTPPNSPNSDDSPGPTPDPSNE